MKEVEAGEVLFFETAEEERAFWDDEDNAALKESLRSKGSIDMTLVDKLIGVELAGALDGAEGTTLVAVSPEDESKFTPEEWAEILKLVEQGKIRWVEFEADMMLEDGTNGAIVSFVSNDDCPFALVDETNSKNASGDVPYYIANEASVKTVKASDGATYKWLSSEGDAYTDIAPGAEMPIGIVTLGKDQSIVVSLICEDSSDCSVIEVGLKKENSSEKLVIKEASGNFDGLTAERSVEESGEYVLYVKNTGKTSAGFSISYLIR